MYWAWRVHAKFLNDEAAGEISKHGTQLQPPMRARPKRPRSIEIVRNHIPHSPTLFLIDIGSQINATGSCLWSRIHDRMILSTLGV